MDQKSVTIRLVKSSIGATKRQKVTLRTLGLKRINQVVTHTATPPILGMLFKIQRWVEVK